MRGPRVAPRPSRGVGGAEARLQPPRQRRPGADELLDLDRRADRGADEARQPLGPEHLVAERRRLVELLGAQRRRAGAGHGGEDRPHPPAAGALLLHRRGLVRPGAVEEREHPVLQRVGEVEEGGVAGRPLDAGREPALRQPVEDPAAEVQRHRPLRAEEPEERGRDARRRALRGRGQRGHVVHGEARGAAPGRAAPARGRAGRRGRRAARRAPAAAGARRSPWPRRWGRGPPLTPGCGCRA